MTDVFGVPLPALMGQLTLGLISGSFYAMLSLGLAVIFGLLNIINFSHGALYMLGAFLALLGLTHFEMNYWVALLLVPALVALIGVAVERLMLRHLYQLDHLYGLLLTFGLALMLEGTMRYFFGISGETYAVPEALQGGVNLGFMFMQIGRAHV